jgi:hypothetical protein
MSETPNGWQPIKTAPRDGTKVMIWLVRQETIAWAQWKDADEYYGIPTNPARWEWQDGGIVSWVPDRPGAVSHWATLEPPPTGGHHE